MFYNVGNYKLISELKYNQQKPYVEIMYVKYILLKNEIYMKI